MNLCIMKQSKKAKSTWSQPFLSCLELLLATSGCQLNLKDHNDCTSLHLAAQLGKSSQVSADAIFVSVVVAFLKSASLSLGLTSNY